MNESPPPIEVAMRIPGQWSHPRELLARLPEGCRVTPEALILPSGARIDLGFMDADDQFPDIFRSSCRQPPTEAERAAADGYTVNVLLSGKGGSLAAAHTMMEAAAALVRAGGAGVFIDNSGLAHGGQNWLEMTEDGGPDAISFAFVAIVRGKSDVWTMGMHVLGLRDIMMRRTDVEDGGYDIVEVIRYLAHGDKPVDDGHIIADLDGPQFQCFAEDGDATLARTPMYNPFGRLRLVNMRDIAKNNQTAVRCMNITDYNGEGLWSREAILDRYARYTKQMKNAPRDLSPREHTERTQRWVYPVMEKVIEGIEAGDPACVQLGVEFIEEDARFPFGKVLKSNTARALRRATLTEQQKQRIRRRVFTMLSAGHVPHEYRQYARLVRKIGFAASEVPNVVTSNPYVARFRDYFEAAARPT